MSKDGIMFLLLLTSSVMQTCLIWTNILSMSDLIDKFSKEYSDFEDVKDKTNLYILRYVPIDEFGKYQLSYPISEETKKLATMHCIFSGEDVRLKHLLSSDLVGPNLVLSDYSECERNLLELLLAGPIKICGIQEGVLEKLGYVVDETAPGYNVVLGGHACCYQPRGDNFNFFIGELNYKVNPKIIELLIDYGSDVKMLGELGSTIYDSSTVKKRWLDIPDSSSVSIIKPSDDGSLELPMAKKKKHGLSQLSHKLAKKKHKAKLEIDASDMQEFYRLPSRMQIADLLRRKGNV